MGLKSSGAAKPTEADKSGTVLFGKELSDSSLFGIPDTTLDILQNKGDDLPLEFNITDEIREEIKREEASGSESASLGLSDIQGP